MVSPLTDKEILKIKRRVKRYLNSYNLGFLQEDCVHEIICRYLEGYHAKATIEQATIDYLRLSIGDKRTGSGILKHNAILQWQEKTPDILFDKLQDVENKIDAHKILSKLDENPRFARAAKMARLYFIEGYRLREIGEEFNLTESRITQILKRVIRRLSESVKKGSRKSKKKNL